MDLMVNMLFLVVILTNQTLRGRTDLSSLILSMHTALVRKC